MTNRDHCNNQDVVVNRVDDAIVSYANSESRTPLEGIGPWWSWILPEERDCPTNAVAILMVNLFRRADCGGGQLDLLGHTQPRSAFA